MSDVQRFRAALEQIAKYPRQRSARLTDVVDTCCAWCGGMSGEMPFHGPSCPARVARETLEGEHDERDARAND